MGIFTVLLTYDRTVAVSEHLSAFGTLSAGIMCHSDHSQKVASMSTVHGVGVDRGILCIGKKQMVSLVTMTLKQVIKMKKR